MRSGFKVALALTIFLCAQSISAQAEDLTRQAGAMEPAKVTMQFQGMDIVEILKLLAEQAGFNLVAGQSVSGKVTLFVKDVDPWEAFEVILAANDLAYEKRGTILSIMTQREYELLHGYPYQDRRIIQSVVPRYAKAADLSRSLTQVKSNIGRIIADEATNTLILMDTPDLIRKMQELIKEMDQPLQTRVFSFNYGLVKTLTPLFQEIITKGVGKISMDERTNQLVVTDTPDKLEQMAVMAKTFDKRSPEVLIDAKILQVALTDQYQYGIDWELLINEKLDFKSAGALNLSSGGALKLGKSTPAGSGDYKFVIEALRTFGDTKVLSEPRILVTNNQEAKILVGSKEPYITTQVSQSGTGTAVTAEQVSFIDVGVKLYVTPTISSEGFISMKIRPEVSSKTGTLITSQKNEIPIVETAEAETVLSVEDQGTVILGGLIRDETSRSEGKTPILGDLPIVKHLFRFRRDSSKKTELLVLLTPRIVTGRRGEPVSSPREKQVESGVDYYSLLVNLIQAVSRTQALAGGEEGTVVVEFTLNPKGWLEGRPRIISSEEKTLEPLAERAVLIASPYPPFPPEAGDESRTFKIPLTYRPSEPL